MSTPPELRKRLRDLARDSIRHGLERQRPVEVALEAWPESLHRQGATFVTLRQHERLRGCIGALEATRPVVQDLAINAFSAAFRDPRFSAVTETDFPALEIHLSLLSPIEPLPFESESDLLQKLRPRVDGLILEVEDRRGTFLPSVWESLPDAADFLSQLKIKAGLERDYWSDQVRAYRYTTEEF